MQVVAHVDTLATIVEVAAARKKPFILQMVARTGVTEAASFILTKHETIGEATAAMYDAFGAVNRAVDGSEELRGDGQVRRIMNIARSLYGDCAFRVNVVKHQEEE